MKQYIYGLVIIYVIGICSLSSDAVEKLTITAVGDIMMGTTYPEELLPPKDGIGIFDQVRDKLGGSDIVLGNLEGPLTESGGQTKCRDDDENCFAFRTPPRYADYLRAAGFNVINISNNHVGDFGKQGIENTRTCLMSVNISPVGGKYVALINVKGKKVAVAGFSFMPVSDYSYSINNILRASEIVNELKKSNDIVIVSFHGGAEGKSALYVTGKEEEFLGEKRGNVREFAHAVVDAGADAVFGHGPHVLRAMELYRGRLIAYSLGNFLTYKRFNIDGESGISMILKIRLDPETGKFAGGEIIPVKLVGEGLPIIDGNREAIKLIKRLTLEYSASSKLTIEDSGFVVRITGKQKISTVRTDH
ncbi:capsule biosynthesis protein CapA [bacterium BMS3Abin07]|nr:capsule biosynthesis protein CapA [bacterium BMS3Abin07]GBE32941.1 capsule biosynthesis protein CapA [bacterium BMS3Bbin05]HDL20046.1 CapA family protein [Nitrospirota bacterium]HDZ87751.1 CapA family protein [Nitrospirota bacterium]